MSVIFGPGIGMQPAQGSLVADTNPVDQAPIVVQATDTQSGNLMEFRSPSGTLLSAVDVNGAIGGGAGLAGAVILAPDASARNTIQPTADNVTPLTVQAHSGGNTSPLLQAFTDPAQTNGVTVTSDGRMIVTPVGGSGLRGLTINPTGGIVIQGIWSAAAVPGAGQFEMNASGAMQWDIRTSTTLHTAVLMTPSWEDPTEATRHSRLAFSTVDAVGLQLPLDLGAGGPGPTIGFLGAAKVPRQVNGTAADLAAIADAPAKAFITALSTALVNLGLLAAPA